MLLVDSYAQNYRWTMQQILDLTMPQIYMINGAAELNRARVEKKAGTKITRRPPVAEQAWHGKRLEDLNSQEYAAYFKASQKMMQD